MIAIIFKKKYYLIFLFITLTACNVKEEKVNETLINDKIDSKYALKIQSACSYDKQIKDRVIYTFDSDNEADHALSKIMNLTGLPSNFVIKAADVENASATIICTDKTNCVRYIFYNQAFMRKIKSETKTHYAEISILAHEIGHHLSGHTLLSSSNPQDQELEADKFSGFVIYKMGGSLENAQSAIRSLSSENGSYSHPPKSARLAAISNGWFEAQKNDSKKSINIKNEIDINKNDSKKPIKINKRKSEYSTYQVGDIEVMADDLTYILNLDEDYMTWDEARNACIMLGDDWRLPTISELKMIYKNRLKIGGFNRSNWTIYWSNNPLNQEDYIWRFDFQEGKAMYDSKRNFANVRAVRDN
jgi:hypothetical protein